MLSYTEMCTVALPIVVVIQKEKKRFGVNKMLEKNRRSYDIIQGACEGQFQEYFFKYSFNRHAIQIQSNFDN